MNILISVIDDMTVVSVLIYNYEMLTGDCFQEGLRLGNLTKGSQ